MTGEVRPEKGAEQHEGKAAERPAAFDKLYGPEATIDKPLAFSRADHVSGLDSAHGAFRCASDEAKAAFLACYADNQDPVLQATLALMIGQKPPSELLNT
jgi:hypothetical protein